MWIRLRVCLCVVGKDGSYKMKGFAMLDEVCEALQIDLQDEEEKLG